MGGKSQSVYSAENAFIQIWVKYGRSIEHPTSKFSAISYQAKPMPMIHLGLGHKVLDWEGMCTNALGKKPYIGHELNFGVQT